MAEARRLRCGNPPAVTQVASQPDQRRLPSPTGGGHGAAPHPNGPEALPGTGPDSAVPARQRGFWRRSAWGRGPGTTVLRRRGSTRLGQIDFRAIRRVELCTARTLVTRRGFRPAEFKIDFGFVKGVWWRRHGFLHPGASAAPQGQKQQPPSQKPLMFSDMHWYISFPPLMAALCLARLPVSHTTTSRCKPMSRSLPLDRSFASLALAPSPHPSPLTGGGMTGEGAKASTPQQYLPQSGPSPRGRGSKSQHAVAIPPPVRPPNGPGTVAVGQAHTERW